MPTPKPLLTLAALAVLLPGCANPTTAPPPPPPQHKPPTQPAEDQTPLEPEDLEYIKRERIKMDLRGVPPAKIEEHVQEIVRRIRERRAKERLDAKERQDTKERQDAKEKLKGTWAVVSMKEGGDSLPEDKLKDRSITFDGDTVALKQGGDRKRGIYTLDPSQKPGHIDLMITGADKPLKLIYQLDGDALKLAGPKGGGDDRPKSFDEAPVQITLKREKK